jgi:hypothetical protein
MADIAWTAPELTGETGLTLYLYTTAGVLINTGGDALSESPASSGRFVATVAESISAIASARLHDAVGPVRDGWLAVGSTLVQDEYPVSAASTVVTVLPATGIVANRSAGVTLVPVVGETISQTITVYQSDGTTAVDLSGKTLKIIFETLSGLDVATVDNADISVGGTSDNVVTFAYPSAVTASERTLRFALRDAAAPMTMYLQGVCSVVAAPKADT